MGIMRIKSSALDIFNSLPNSVLTQIAINDFEALQELCQAITLDVQLLKENNKHNNIEQKPN